MTKANNEQLHGNPRSCTNEEPQSGKTPFSRTKSAKLTFKMESEKQVFMSTKQYIATIVLEAI